MGLYLCVMEDEDDVAGVGVGRYEDFGVLRDTICAQLEGGRRGSRFPVLMLHSDCDGEWSPADARALLLELEQIGRELGTLAPVALPTGWRQQVAKSLGIAPRSLRDCFFDVDGEPLFERLAELCQVAIQRDLPIVFQ